MPSECPERGQLRCACKLLIGLDDLFGCTLPYVIHFQLTTDCDETESACNVIAVEVKYWCHCI